jgi:hypothetical protein
LLLFDVGEGVADVTLRRHDKFAQGA